MEGPKVKDKGHRPAWRRAMWMLVLLLLPWVTSKAGNDMENSVYWMITPSGVNGVNIQIPVYDSGGLDGFVDEGFLYITPDGGAQVPPAAWYQQYLVGVFVDTGSRLLADKSL